MSDEKKEPIVWKVFKPDNETILNLSTLANDLPVGEHKLIHYSYYDQLKQQLKEKDAEIEKLKHDSDRLKFLEKTYSAEDIKLVELEQENAELKEKLNAHPLTQMDKELELLNMITNLNQENQKLRELMKEMGEALENCIEGFEGTFDGFWDSPLGKKLGGSYENTVIQKYQDLMKGEK